MIGVKSSGSFSNTEKFFKRVLSRDQFNALDQYGKQGVNALARATPVDSGLTAQSWSYRIVRNNNRYGIEWFNTNVVNGVNVAILLQYGHGTGTGGYVSGRDYINPAIQPIFDQIADDVWKKVTLG